MLEPIAGRLKFVLSQSGMSNAALSRRSGLRLDAIGRLQKAERLPELQPLQDLAKALGVPAGWLVFGEGHPPHIEPCAAQDADQRVSGNRNPNPSKLAK